MGEFFSATGAHEFRAWNDCRQSQGVTLDTQAFATSTPVGDNGVLARFESTLLGGDVSEQTHATIVKQLNDGKTTSAMVAGLILGSPEFQRR
jgi:hypothetical protein